MSEWKTCKLSEIGEIVGGATPSTKNPNFYDGEIPWITPKDLTNWSDMYISKGERSITKAGYDSASCKMMPKGTVLFTSRAPIGYIAIAANDVCTNQGFKSVVPNTDLIDSQFLYYSLIFNKNKIIAMGSGTTFAEISGKVMASVEISLPPLDIQKKIAAQLSEIDDKIAVNKKICENLEAQAQTLFKHWFVDFAPFKDGKFIESELGLIPEGWRMGTLGDIADITMGQSPAGSSYNEKGEGIIFYQGRTEFGFRYPSVRLYTTEPKRFAEPLSTLLSVRAPVGDINVATDKCCIGRGLASIKSNNNCHSYIFYLLQSMKRRFDVYNGEGTVFGSINKDTLNDLKIIIPSNSVILEFEEIVKEMDKKILESHLENLCLSTLRETLLPKLMSGELSLE